MGSFDARGLRHQRQQRRSQVREMSELRQLPQADLSRLSVGRLVLSEVPATLAVRLVLMLLFRLLRLRIDSGTLSALKGEALRKDIVDLVSDLAYGEPEVAPTSLPDAPPASPMPRAAISGSAATPAEAVTPAPEVKELSGHEFTRQLSPEELRMFERAAGKNMKHIFEEAIHAEYRESLIQMFGGPIHVRPDPDHARTPRLFVRFQGSHECVLPDDRDRMVASNPRALTKDRLDEATAQLWELWKAARRPPQLDISGLVAS